MLVLFRFAAAHVRCHCRPVRRLGSWTARPSTHVTGDSLAWSVGLRIAPLKTLVCNTIVVHAPPTQSTCLLPLRRPPLASLCPRAVVTYDHQVRMPSLLFHHPSINLRCYLSRLPLSFVFLYYDSGLYGSLLPVTETVVSSAQLPRYSNVASLALVGGLLAS